MMHGISQLFRLHLVSIYSTNACNSIKIYQIWQSKRGSSMQRIAVITGATSGIGAAFAKMLAAKGHDLFITGRREKKLRSLSNELISRFGISATVLLGDLGDPAVIGHLVERISKLPFVDILINNAGFGLDSLFLENVTKHDEMLSVHVVAALSLMRAVLPGMISRGSGSIINVASVAGFLPVPRGATYSATKSFLISVTESVHMELAKSGIRTQALCPGLTVTDFHDREGSGGAEIRKSYPFKWMNPNKVVDISLRALGSNKVIVIPGLINKLFVRCSPLIPRRLYYRLAEAARR